MKSCKIIFLGTPEVSAKVLETIYKAGYQIDAVITNKDMPVGRKQTLTAPPVKVFAEKNNIPVLQPEKLSEVDWQKYDLKNTLAIVVAYGKIIPQSVIDLFPLGMLNIHYSLLPKYRGASPVEQAILNGDKETGVTIQKLIFKLDAGPIISTQKYILNNEITTPELKNVLTEIGSNLLIETLPKYLTKEITPQEQDESLATHCGKIEKAEGEIKNSDSEINKWRKYRAFLGWPGTFYFDENGKRVKITLATFENEKFIIKKIIREGGSEVSI